MNDLKEIINKFESIQSFNKIILTTEKDAVRLMKFNDQLKDIPLYVIPIRHHFLFDQGPQFNEMVVNYIQHFKFNPVLYEKK